MQATAELRRAGARVDLASAHVALLPLTGRLLRSGGATGDGLLFGRCALELGG